MVPESSQLCEEIAWIPAFAGMTVAMDSHEACAHEGCAREACARAGGERVWE